MHGFPRLLATVLVASATAGCAIPPRPAPPALSTTAPLTGVAGSADATWPTRRWWQRYDDAQLDMLESRALSGSPTLAVARARFDEALRAVDVARAAGGASLEGNVQLQRQRLSEHGLIPSEFLGFNWYSQGDLGLQFRYDFDFWGSNGSAIAAAVDNARAAAAERDAAASMLTAAVAQTYFDWQSDQARLTIANAMLDIDRQGRNIAAARVAQGVDAADSVHQADARLAETREQLAKLSGSARIRETALAALLGAAPADLTDLKPRPLPPAKAGLPKDAGLDLVARRADVAASRWRVEAAVRNLDIARDAFYPDLSLSALVGLSSIDLGKLLSAGSSVVAAGPALHLPIFESGRLKARFGVSKAQLAGAVAGYNASVVQAAKDVATQTLTVRQVQARLQEQARQLDARRQLYASARARAERGVTDARPVLAAEAELQHQRDLRTQLVATALSAEIALTHALGGGYRTQSESVTESSGATSR